MNPLLQAFYNFHKLCFSDPLSGPRAWQGLASLVLAARLGEPLAGPLPAQDIGNFRVWGFSGFRV